MAAFLIYNDCVRHLVLLWIFISAGCDGDSGGPIWISGEKGIVLVGVYSQGFNSKYASHPECTGAGVVVKINKKVSDWIHRWKE